MSAPVQLPTHPAQWINVADAEAAAKVALPPAIWDYIAGGAEDEQTMHANRAAFARRLLRPRMLVDVSAVETATTLLDAPVAFPLIVAPSSLHRMYHPDGEAGTYRAASRVGALMTVSSAGSTPLEEVAQAADGMRWFQLYCFRERAMYGTFVEAAAAAGYRALVLTADVQILGRRERDMRNNFVLPAGVRMANFERRFAGLPDGTAHAHLMNVANPAITWDDLAWIRSLSDLPLVVKGILTAEDARLAVEHGAAAIWVSNHGGRQLDCAPATLDILEEIVEAVDGRAEIVLDGGVRRGTDILKALALGARAVAVGRVPLYGLAAGGEAGAFAVLEMLRNELQTAMMLCGVLSVASVPRSLVKTA